MVPNAVNNNWYILSLEHKGNLLTKGFVLAIWRFPLHLQLRTLLRNVPFKSLLPKEKGGIYECTSCAYEGKVCKLQEFTNYIELWTCCLKMRNLRRNSVLNISDVIYFNKELKYLYYIKSRYSLLVCNIRF